MTSNRPSYVTVVAIAHPVGRPNSYNGGELTRGDIQRLTEATDQRRVPTYLEHRRELGQTGEVIRFHLAKGDQLGIVALLDINSTSGSVIYRALQAGEYVGMSVQVEWEANERGRVISRDLLEISYTRYPRLAGTQVQYVSEMLISNRGTPLQKEYDQLFENIYKLMEAEKKVIAATGGGEQQATTPAATPAAANPNPSEPEKRPFPAELLEGVPEHHKARYMAYLMKEAEKEKEQAERVKGIAEVVKKRKGVSSFNTFGLDTTHPDGRYGDVREMFLDAVDAMVAEKMEQLGVKPGTTTLPQQPTATMTTTTTKSVTITDGSKAQQQQQQLGLDGQSPLKMQRVTQTNPLDVLYEKEFLKYN